MISEDTLMIALVRTYSTHRRFFYINNFENFKLFVSWLTGESIGTESVGTQLPWYRQNYEVQELAKILKCSEQELLGLLGELYE